MQINPCPIGNIVNRMREKIDPWLGIPSWKQNDGRFVLYYKYTAESGVSAKIKI